MRHAARTLLSLFSGAVASTALATGAVAAPITFPLIPGHSEVKLTGYGAGFIPNSGAFHDYKGTLTIDPDDVHFCKVDLTMQVKSLDMGMVTSTVLSKDFLDPDTYPTTSYTGSCKASGDGTVLSGQLTMHGQTHPFDLKVTFRNHVLTNVGTLKRSEWGVTGHQGMIGNSTKVTVITQLPSNITFEKTAAE